MLTLFQREPARIIGVVVVLAIMALLKWAPLDDTSKHALVGVLVLGATELVRSQVTPTAQTSGGAP